MGKFLDKTGLATFWTKCKDTFVKKSGVSTITGDNGTITFDPDGTGEHNVYECGISIKMNDQTYAKIEPANISLYYNGNNFTMSAEEAYIGIQNGSIGDGTYNNSQLNPGFILVEGTYGNIRINTTDDDEGNVYLKLTNKDDPDNYYTHIGPSFIHFQGDANYFGMWVEDGLMEMGNDEYISSMGLGCISFTSPDWHIQMTAGAGSASGVPAIRITKKSNWNDYEYTFPEKSGTFALTNDFKTINGQSIIGTGDITISGGGSVDFYKAGYLYAYGMRNPNAYDAGEDIAFGFNDCAEPTIQNSYGRFICISTTGLDGDYEYYHFPERSGTVALTDDIETAKTYQHDIYIMPGNSNAGGVYIYLTLNIRRSAKISSVADLCSVLYNRGNNVQQQAVSATGKAGASSTSFSGFIVGVWASSTSTLNVVYVTTTGTLTTTSYSASMFTSMRDTVN